MRKVSHLNVPLLLLSLVSTVLLTAVNRALIELPIPYPILSGIILMLALALVFVATYTSEKFIRSGNYIKRGQGMFNQTCAHSATILLPLAFLLGVLTQILYGFIGTETVTPPNFKGTTLVCDISDSMNNNDKERNAVAALTGYIQSVRLGEYLGVILFNDQIFSIRAYSALQTEEERAALITQVQNVATYTGGTDIQAAVLQAIRDMRTGGANGWPSLCILLSDGESDVYLQTVQKASKGSSVPDTVPVNTIFYGTSGGWLMEQIAQSTGGTYIHIGDSGDLRRAFTMSRTSYVISRPLLSDAAPTASRENWLRIVLQFFFLTVWSTVIAAALTFFLNNDRLFRDFLIPRLVISTVLCAVVAVVSPTGIPFHAALAVSLCVLYLPRYEWV